MNARWKRWLGFASDQRGGVLVEYVIVVALVAAVGVGTWQVFGKEIQEHTENARKTIDGELDKGSGD